MYKSAFISIVGLPNAGKSTLLNSILGQELVITTKKAQTTRHRIKGILTEGDIQLVFSDTPGIIEEAAYKMQEQMIKVVKESLDDADILMCVIDGSSKEDLLPLAQLLGGVNCHKLLIINKVDLLKQEQVLELIPRLENIFNTSDIFPISATEKFNIESLMHHLKEIAPEHPHYFDADIISDEDIRFHVTEKIREQLLIQFDKEIPYSAEVAITEYKETTKIDKIYATIYVERPSQRGIIIGKNGDAIKKLGTYARKKIEIFLDKKVFLDLSVKVKENWRSDELQLKYFGYIK